MGCVLTVHRGSHCRKVWRVYAGSTGCGRNWKDSLIVGTLMNTRGLMQLVALNIGFEMGILSAQMFVVLLIMSLLTTFMATPMLSLVEKIFAKQEEKAHHHEKVLLSFGRPETGRTLLVGLIFTRTSAAKQSTYCHALHVGN